MAAATGFDSGILLSIRHLALIVCLKTSPTLVAAEVTRPKHPGFPGGERRQSEPPHVGCYVFVASGVSRIICLRRAFDKLRKTRKLEPTHVGCYYSNRLKKISALAVPFLLLISPSLFLSGLGVSRGNSIVNMLSTNQYARPLPTSMALASRLL
jgi:hypothetical protein